MAAEKCLNFRLRRAARDDRVIYGVFIGEDRVMVLGSANSGRVLIGEVLGNTGEVHPFYSEAEALQCAVRTPA